MWVMVIDVDLNDRYLDGLFASVRAESLSLAVLGCRVWMYVNLLSASFARVSLSNG